VAAVDDRTMLILVGELLDHPDESDEYILNPEVLRELLMRLRELLEREASRRPSHRPKNDTGELVATLNQIYKNLARAKREAARRKNKSVRTVAKAYERFLNEKRQK
jgi:hypothetical protein